MDISGKVIKVLPETRGEGKNGQWVKQDFVIETTDQYPKKVCFSLWGDKTAALRGLGGGEMVKVHFAPESREYNGRWYTELRAWRLEKNSSDAEGSQQSGPDFDESFFSQDNAADDLPF